MNASASSQKLGFGAICADHTCAFMWFDVAAVDQGHCLWNADITSVAAGANALESEEAVTASSQVLAFIEALFTLHAARQVRFASQCCWSLHNFQLCLAMLLQSISSLGSSLYIKANTTSAVAEAWPSTVGSFKTLLWLVGFPMYSQHRTATGMRDCCWKAFLNLCALSLRAQSYDSRCICTGHAACIACQVHLDCLLQASSVS